MASYFSFEKYAFPSVALMAPRRTTAVAESKPTGALSKGADQRLLELAEMVIRIRWNGKRTISLRLGLATAYANVNPGCAPLASWLADRQEQNASDTWRTFTIGLIGLLICTAAAWVMETG